MEAETPQYSLPLVDLFTQLRQAGLPLGVGEYQLLIRALQGGFGLPDRAALERLCKVLWIKSDEEEILFDYHFERLFPFVVGERSILFEEPSTSTSPKSAPTSPKPASTDETSVPVDEESSPTEEPSTSFTSATDSELTMIVGDDKVQVVKALRQTVSRDNSLADDPFVQTDEYFPITRRQMKQSWRYLRRVVPQGPSVELDIEATVNQAGYLGIFLEPVLVPRRTNRVKLFLLIDQSGSMVPFHGLSRRLAETALRGGRLGKANIYYFHNWPEEYLYHDPYQLEAEPIQDVLNQFRAEHVVLIFSDAGAARGGFNELRIDRTARFLERLKQQVRYTAWLNPMPRSRWLGTTADEITYLIPMFEISRHGLDQAINVLRGRLTAFAEGEKRR